MGLIGDSVPPKLTTHKLKDPGGRALNWRHPELKQWLYKNLIKERLHRHKVWSQKDISPLPLNCASNSREAKDNDIFLWND